MHGWIDYYAPAGAARPAPAAPAPGQLWRAEPVALPPRHALRIDRLSPRDPARATVGFVALDDATATPDHPPVTALGLRSDERATIAAARERTVIVLGGDQAVELRGDDAVPAGTVLVVPLEPLADRSAALRRRIAAYAFPNAFYLPAEPSRRAPEHVAWLDQAQPVARERLTAPAGLALTADALDALIEWHVAYATGRRLDGSLIADYRRERLAELDAE